MDRKLIISCEHAGNEIPPAYQNLFDGKEDVLESHRGWDIGALELAETLRDQLGVQLHIHKISRLLIDINRSLHHPSLFSEFMGDVKNNEREKIITLYYKSYRAAIKQQVEDAVAGGQGVVHISVHTFTPILNDMVRAVDVGFLYNPKRAAEKEFCRAWRKELQNRLPVLKFRMNYPYRGVMDGLTTALRKEFSAPQYYGIELEVNQKFAQSGEEDRWHLIQHTIADALEETLL